MIKICRVCGAEFVAPRSKRIVCSKRCGGLYSAIARGDNWHPEELDLIEKAADVYHGETIAKRLQALQRKNGWKVRSTTAILTKLKRCGVSRRPTLNNFSRNELARVLGVPHDRVRSWTRHHGLPYQKIHDSCYAIQTFEFTRWAASHLELIADIDRETLEWIGMPHAVLAAMPPQRIVRSARRPVRCLDTGEVFESVHEAGRRKFLSPKSISSAISRCGRSAGMRWQYVEAQ
jgi:hypothetical protein